LQLPGSAHVGQVHPFRATTLPKISGHAPIDAGVRAYRGDHEVPTMWAHAMGRSIGVNLVRSEDRCQESFESECL
jgi:hypothetical protein